MVVPAASRHITTGALTSPSLDIMKHFEPFTEDVFIPSIGEDFKINYTKVDKDLWNEAVLSYWMSGPDADTNTN